MVRVVLIVLAFACGGCSYDSLDKPVRLYPSRHAEVSGRVGHDGLHWTVLQSRDGRLRPLGDARFAANRGDRLGLRLNPDGVVVALVNGGHHRVLGELPWDAAYVAWATDERRAGMRDPLAGLAGVNIGLRIEGFNPVEWMLAAVVEAAFDALLGRDDDDDGDEDSADRRDRYEHLERHAAPSRRRTREE